MAVNANGTAANGSRNYCAAVLGSICHGTAFMAVYTVIRLLMVVYAMVQLCLAAYAVVRLPI